MRLMIEPTVRVINDGPGQFAPSKAGDVGHDLYANLPTTKRTWLDRWIARTFDESIICVIWPFMNKSVGSGVKVSMPDSVWCKVEARSSTGKKQMSVDGGVIDSGYRGEMFAVLSNKSLMPRVIRQGERYAQVVFHWSCRPPRYFITHFDSLDASDRGDTGFGSSGQ